MMNLFLGFDSSVKLDNNDFMFVLVGLNQLVTYTHDFAVTVIVITYSDYFDFQTLDVYNSPILWIGILSKQYLIVQARFEAKVKIFSYDKVILSLSVTG